MNRGIEGVRPTLDELAQGVITSWANEIDAIKKRLNKGTRTKVDFTSPDLSQRFEEPLTPEDQDRLDERLYFLTGRIDRYSPRPGRVARRRFIANGYFRVEEREMAMERQAVLRRLTHGQAAQFR